MRRRVVREDERELWLQSMRDVNPLSTSQPSAQSSLLAGTGHAQPPASPTSSKSARSKADAKAAAKLAKASASQFSVPPPQSLADALAQQPAMPAGTTPLAARHRRHVIIPETAPAMPRAEAAMAAHLRSRVDGCTHSGFGLEIGGRLPGLDDRSWRTLTMGLRRTERRLDLHGLAAQAAFHNLREFLFLAHAEGVRCVEIVTGLGSGKEGGVLRRELPFWLGRVELRDIILAATHSHAANHGSVRVLLRRRAGR